METIEKEGNLMSNEEIKLKLQENGDPYFITLNEAELQVECFKREQLFPIRGEDSKTLKPVPGPIYQKINDQAGSSKLKENMKCLKTLYRRWLDEAPAESSTTKIGRLKSKRLHTSGKERYTILQNSSPGRMLLRRESSVQTAPSSSKASLPNANIGKKCNRCNMISNRSRPNGKERYTILQNSSPGRMLLRRESSVQTAPSSSKVESSRSCSTPDKRSHCKFKNLFPDDGPRNVNAENIVFPNDLTEILDLTEDDDASEIKIQRAFFKGSAAIPDKEGPDNIFKKPLPVRIMLQRKSSDPVDSPPSKIIQEILRQICHYCLRSKTRSVLLSCNGDEVLPCVSQLHPVHVL
ncbi:hypothetical protein CEXT_469231 [Caerostris extrusa]|uniref:Uncharacterized protein n=1 Tax=Caerostris extrusa TaxID=172846 RepID=A0AAV4TUN9_CAEEX|nr:hypothetical protein CEXT_469231 [Caerostris extrusa]